MFMFQQDGCMCCFCCLSVAICVVKNMSLLFVAFLLLSTVLGSFVT